MKKTQLFHIVQLYTRAKYFMRVWLLTGVDPTHPLLLIWDRLHQKLNFSGEARQKKGKWTAEPRQQLLIPLYNKVEDENGEKAATLGSLGSIVLGQFILC